jgi:hypothetical protein
LTELFVAAAPAANLQQRLLFRLKHRHDAARRASLDDPAGLVGRSVRNAKTTNLVMMIIAIKGGSFKPRRR